MKTNKGPVTVQYILIFLASKLTQYDARCEARGDRNLYRLGHLLKAAHNVQRRLMPEPPYTLDTQEVDVAWATKLRTAISAEFAVDLRQGKYTGIAPVNQTLRAIDKAVAGARVSICDSTGARTHVG